MKYHPNTLGIIKCAIPGSWPRALAERGLTGRKIKTILPRTNAPPPSPGAAVELRVFWKRRALGYMAEWRSCLGRGFEN